MKKVYLAGGISDIARKEYQRNMARKIRLAGAYEVYAAAENDSINDKSNDPTPLDIYNADISALRSSDMFVQTISGGNEDGTNYESGVIAGINEERVRFSETLNKVMYTMLTSDDIDEMLNTIFQELFDFYEAPIEVLAYTINERQLEPQFYKGERDDIIGIPSGGYNHLILGGIDKWGKFVGLEKDLLKSLDNDNEI